MTSYTATSPLLPRPRLTIYTPRSTAVAPEHYPVSSPMQPRFRHEHNRYQRAVSRSCTKYLERRLINVWKRVTRTMRRAERASVLPEGFVLLNSRRRSIYYK
ncbi:hypothetical protein DENSPDRAFT_836057 [Dentipellis sp. KUC8613]|nr:hypothetical protein DENSPDRAFT_836057 [Dentipellis sp. KUC8613]